MAEIVFRPLESGDIDHVTAHLCEGERETLRDMGVTDNKDAISRAVLISETCEAAVLAADGKALCFVGVVPVSLLDGVGNLWMLATGDLFKNPGVLVRASRRHVQRLHESYPRLVGRIDARRTGTLKWLRLLGFSVGAPCGDGPVKFCDFERDHVPS